MTHGSDMKILSKRDDIQQDNSGFCNNGSNYICWPYNPDLHGKK